MRFLSTRGQSATDSFAEAVELGLAPDGGLFLPDPLPDLRPFLRTWEHLPYAELCARFLSLFAPSSEVGDWSALTAQAYRLFAHPEVAPLVTLHDRLRVLELFHGPTLAFKDFALQVLGLLYEAQIRRTGRPIHVLGATSGDTGAAAIHGLLGRQSVRVFILYPDGRVSPLQERQMACTGAANVFAIAIDGSFDDAQKVLKETFEDAEFSRRYGLSAVNSINLARILAQSVYYLYAWFRLPQDQREEVEFVVPTGNFGNVLSGWMVRRMGVPMGGFRVATNQNDILHRLFATGEYKVGKVHPSHAPSMDIQVASNFERFLYYLEGEDPDRVRLILSAFRQNGVYTFTSFKSDGFASSRTTDDEILHLVREVERRYGYACDPHTACGFRFLLDPALPDRPRVVLATAHPAKFPEVMGQALGRELTDPSLEALKHKPLSKHRLAADASAVQDFIRRNAIRGF